jgi:hypothetical protein
MSIDKELADIALEIPADDAASSATQDDPAALPPLETAQDLLEWVQTDPDLSPQQRCNEMSAIRTLGAVDNTPLAAISLEDGYLFKDRYKAIRAAKSLKQRRRSDVITLVNRVLKRAGITKVGSKRLGPTSAAWIQVLESLTHGNDRNSLSPFAKYCSERKIEPHQVTLQVWQDFVDETLHHTGIKKPRETVRRVVAASNRARAKNAGWPLPELPKLTNPRIVSKPESSFPASLWTDFAEYARLSSTPCKDIFAKNWPKQLAPDTLIRYREVAKRTASAQVHRDRPASDITSLEAMLDIKWLKEGVQWSYERAGNKFLKDHLNMAATWVSMARNYVRPAPEILIELRKGIMDKIAQELGSPEFSRRNIEKLEQFNDPKIVEDFQLLPFRIMDEVSRKKVITIEDATLMQAALAMELFLTTMVRRKNVAKTDHKLNFWPAKPRPDGTWTFRVEGTDVKNHVDLNFKLGKHTTCLIEFYIKKCWPLLAKGPTTKLFLKKDGVPKKPVDVAYLVTSIVRKRLGLDVNVHLFRHIGAMLFLDKHPGSFEVVRVMLGHKSILTTQKFYARLKATKAIELFTSAVFGERDAMIDKLKLGGKVK